MHIQTERDWPQGHPKAEDYKGEKYTAPPPPLGRDWPEGHPKAADSPANIAESEAARLETTDAGETPQTTAGTATDQEAQLAEILKAGENFQP